MATVVNERDKLLQASASRFAEVTLPPTVIVPATKSLTLTASSLIFKVPTAGPALPSSITLTATKKAVTGSVTFSVISGTASLSGTGDTRTLAYADMITDSVTFSASLTEGASTYTSTVTIAKIRDGSNGTSGSNGSDGRRGSVDLYVTGSAWSDATANSTITSSTGSSTKYAGDKVTIYNNAGFAETRYWNGISSWVSGQIVNGNMLVTGTVTSDKVGTNELSAVNINTTGVVKSTGSFTATGAYKAAVQGFNSEAAQSGVFGYGSYAVTGFNQHTDNISGASLRGITQGNTGVALWIGGKFKWEGSSGVYVYAAPDGSTDKFMCADGTWKAVTASVTYTAVYNATNGQNLNVNATSVGGYTASDLVSAMNSAINDNNNNFVTTNFIRRSGSSFTLTIPGVGTWSGCTVS